MEAAASRGDQPLLRHRLAGRVVLVFQPGEESLTGARAMLADGVLERFRPSEIHALHCGPFPVGEFVVTPGTGLPGQDRGTIGLTGPDAAARAGQLAARINALGTVPRPGSPADLERLIADVETPHGPLERFVFMQARPAATGVRGPSRLAAFRFIAGERRLAGLLVSRAGPG